MNRGHEVLSRMYVSGLRGKAVKILHGSTDAYDYSANGFWGHIWGGVETYFTHKSSGRGVGPKKGWDCKLSKTCMGWSAGGLYKAGDDRHFLLHAQPQVLKPTNAAGNDRVLAIPNKLKKQTDSE